MFQNDFKCFPKTDLRYQVCQTSRANQNDLHLQKLEIIYIIDVSLVVSCLSFQYANWHLSMLKTFFQFAICNFPEFILLLYLVMA